MRNLFTLILLAALLPLTVRADECDNQPLPLVVETYDSIACVREFSAEYSWDVHRLQFFRDGRLIAERIVCDDMLLSLNGGFWVLCWNDYGNCHRVVMAPTWVSHTVDLDGLPKEKQAPWWGMGNRATDLRAPEAAP